MVWRMAWTSAVCISQMVSSSSTASLAFGLWEATSFRPRNPATMKHHVRKLQWSSTRSGNRRKLKNKGAEGLTHDLLIRTENTPPQGSDLLGLALGQGVRCRALLMELLLQLGRLGQACLGFDFD